MKANSLTGADIKESKLKQVPSAANAANAANADRIGGLSAAQLATSDKFVTANVLVPEGQEHAIMSFGPFTVIARCVTSQPGVSAAMRVTTSGAGAYALVVPGNSEDMNFSAPEVKNASLGSATTPDKSVTGSFDLHDPVSGIAVQGTLHAYLNYGGEHCRFAGVATAERP